MTDRCPKCNTEFGPDDRYCHECGAPRRRAEASAEAPPTEPARARRRRLARDPLSQMPPGPDDDDFVPLVFPQEPAGGWSRFGGGRVAVAILFGVLLLGIAGVAAWTAIDTGGEDPKSPVGAGPLGQVIGGSPPAATPVAGDVTTPAPDRESSSAPINDVAGNNMDPQGASTAATPHVRRSPATGSAAAAVGHMPPATARSLSVTPTLRASPESVAATPAAIASPTRSPGAYPGSLASALTVVVAGIEATPTASPDPPPAGDGTGGVPLPIPPGG